MDFSISYLKCCIFSLCFVLVPCLNAQVVSVADGKRQLNELLRQQQTTPIDEQLVTLDELVAAADVMHSDKLTVAAGSYRLLLLSKNKPNLANLPLIEKLYPLSVRLQDYRSQTFLLRGKLLLQAEQNDPTLYNTKQNLLLLLNRPLADELKAEIVYDIALADMKSANVLSAMDFLQQAEQQFWALQSYNFWRQVVTTEVTLYAKLHWYEQAVIKQQQLIAFTQTNTNSLPWRDLLRLLPLLQGAQMWQDIADYAMELYDFANKNNHLQGQFQAIRWLIKVNIEQQDFALASRWFEKLQRLSSANPQLAIDLDSWLDKLEILVALEQIGQAEQLIAVKKPLWLSGQESPAMFARYHRIEGDIARIKGDVGQMALSYNTVIETQANDHERLFSATIDQVAKDYASLQQASQHTINHLSKQIELAEDNVEKEIRFNNMLIIIVVILMVLMTIIVYFYIRLKNKKQRDRRSRRSRSY
jgi:hypothetical protein